MTGARDWRHYLHGSIVVVPGGVAAWLNDKYRFDLARTQVRGIDPEVDDVLFAITHAAKQWRLTDHGSIPNPFTEPLRQWVSTGTAAGLLGISDRAVRAAITSHKLPAEQVDGRWQIARHDVENYRIARANRAA